MVTACCEVGHLELYVSSRKRYFLLFLNKLLGRLSSPVAHVAAGKQASTRRCHICRGFCLRAISTKCQRSSWGRWRPHCSLCGEQCAFYGDIQQRNAVAMCTGSWMKPRLSCVQYKKQLHWHAPKSAITWRCVRQNIPRAGRQMHEQPTPVVAAIRYHQHSTMPSAHQTCIGPGQFSSETPHCGQLCSCRISCSYCF